MPKFVIERHVPGVGKMAAADVKAMSQKSCELLRGLSPRVQWQQSYITENKLYCVYIADDEAAVREHAQLGGFPIDALTRVSMVIDPTTAEGAR